MRRLVLSLVTLALGVAAGFLTPGVTDLVANDGRGPSMQASPQVLTIANPTAGRHYLVVNRAKVGGAGGGDFGSFVLTLDEVRP